MGMLLLVRYVLACKVDLSDVQCSEGVHNMKEIV